MIWVLFVCFDEGCHVTQVYFESALPCFMWCWRQKPGLCASKTSTLSTELQSQQILSGLGIGRGFSWVGLVLKLLVLSNLEDLLQTSLTSHCWTLVGGTVHHVMFPKWQFALPRVRDQGRATFSVPRLRSLSAGSLFPPLNICICLCVCVFFSPCMCLYHMCAVPLEARRQCLIP